MSYRAGRVTFRVVAQELTPSYIRDWLAPGVQASAALSETPGEPWVISAAGPELQDAADSLLEMLGAAHDVLREWRSRYEVHCDAVLSWTARRTQGGCGISTESLQRIALLCDRVEFRFARLANDGPTAAK